MKKFLFTVAAIFMSIGISSAANANTLVIEANEDGEVIIDKELSKDDKSYVLYEADPGTDFLVTQSAITTFAAMDYRQGLFDLQRALIDFEKTTYQTLLFNNSITSGATNNRVSGTIVLNAPVRLVGYYFYGLNLRANFYYQNTLVGSIGPVTGNNKYANYYKDKIDKITYSVDANSWEIEFFVNVYFDYIAVSNLNAKNITENSATVNWNNPDSEYFRYNAVFVDGEEIVKNTTNTSVALEDLKGQTEYEVTVRSYYVDGKYVDVIYTFKTSKDNVPPGNPTNLTVVQTVESMHLSWNAPAENDLSHYQIYRNSNLIADNVKSLSYTDDSPSRLTNVYKIVAVDTSDNKSAGTTASITFAEAKIMNLEAVAPDFTAVQLKWKNPERTDFEKVTIYRKKNQNSLARMFSFFSTNDEYTPLFETDGKTFKDLTVEADTSYTYLLTATHSGEEGEAVTVDIKTPQLAVIGGSSQVNNDGDFVFNWTAPTSGKVRIDVAGKTYKTVDASDKSITIPKSIMQYDAFGTPLITLTPVDSNGNPIGKTTTATGSSGGLTTGKVTMPSQLTAKNVLLSVVGFAGVFGGFLLLALALNFVPKLIKMINNARGERSG